MNIINERVEDYKNKFPGISDLEIMARIIWDISDTNKNIMPSYNIGIAGDYQVMIPKDVNTLDINFANARISRSN